MKSSLLILLVASMGSLHISESFSEDLIPSCNGGAFVKSDVQCYIQDSPPCQKPSFEKDGLCVVKKSDLCKGDGVLVDGECTIDLGNFRVNDPTFADPHLLAGEPIVDPDPSNFRESGESVGLFYACSGIGLVGIVFGFLIIKKWKNRT